MTAQAIQRDRLGALAKIGHGGQGVVYRAPNVKTKFAASMVYKEYKPQTRTDIDFTALAAMPALVEDSLSYAQAERLVWVAAWPRALIEANCTPTGFVMPTIPQEFFIPLTTVKGVSNTTAEFPRLLNHASVLAARGVHTEMPYSTMDVTLTSVSNGTASWSVSASSDPRYPIGEPVVVTLGLVWLANRRWTVGLFASMCQRGAGNGGLGG